MTLPCPVAGARNAARVNAHCFEDDNTSERAEEIVVVFGGDVMCRPQTSRKKGGLDQMSFVFGVEGVGAKSDRSIGSYDSHLRRETMLVDQMVENDVENKGTRDDEGDSDQKEGKHSFLPARHRNRLCS